MLKLMLIFLVGAIIEAVQMIVIKKDYFDGTPDPDAIT